MASNQIRGYAVTRQAAFIDSHFSAEVAAAMKGKLPTEISAALEQIDPAGWYPREHFALVSEAIASATEDEQKCYRNLVDCGRFISNEATNTYLRLLLKILTPAMFAKKIPSFWARDHRSGCFDVDISRAKENRIAMCLRDVEGFPHIGAISAGFIEFGMEAVGKSSCKVEQRGWSKATPAPAEIHYDVTW